MEKMITMDEVVNIEVVVVDALKSVLSGNPQEMTPYEETREEFIGAIRDLSATVQDLIFDLSGANVLIEMKEAAVQEAMGEDLKADIEMAKTLRVTVKDMFEKAKTVASNVKKGFEAAMYRTKRDLDKLQKIINRAMAERGVAALQAELKGLYEQRRDMVAQLNEANRLKRQAKAILASPELIMEAAVEKCGIVGNA